MNEWDEVDSSLNLRVKIINMHVKTLTPWHPICKYSYSWLFLLFRFVYLTSLFLRQALMYLSLLLTHDDAENDLEPVVFPSPPSEYWDYRFLPQCLVYTVLRIRPQSVLYLRQTLYQLRYP